jgi:hypothetical protein
MASATARLPSTTTRTPTLSSSSIRIFKSRGWIRATSEPERRTPGPAWSTVPGSLTAIDAKMADAGSSRRSERAQISRAGPDGARPARPRTGRSQASRGVPDCSDPAELAPRRPAGR